MRPSRLIFLCLLVLPSAVFAGDFASLMDARKVTDKAVSLFQQEKIVAGYEALKPYWPLASEILQTSKTQNCQCSSQENLSTPWNH